MEVVAPPALVDIIEKKGAARAIELMEGINLNPDAFFGAFIEYHTACRAILDFTAIDDCDDY